MKEQSKKTNSANAFGSLIGTTIEFFDFIFMLMAVLVFLSYFFPVTIVR
jgi:hypothetical protein